MLPAFDDGSYFTEKPFIGFGFGDGDEEECGEEDGSGCEEEKGFCAHWGIEGSQPQEADEAEDRGEYGVDELGGSHHGDECSEAEVVFLFEVEGFCSGTAAHGQQVVAEGGGGGQSKPLAEGECDFEFFEEDFVKQAKDGQRSEWGQEYQG